ncbi:hypothetical protein CYMTET_40926 [Cymbomonas tetramitiformis]|uniref:Uncharacterized protein n=1 Tax=Cymbomonas tetramitiformis TaxID=36881 RepID=A0AAE0C745_9CHLO|nr:hypothetical protein CYMTET_40926 [Cymbomonas tetramitiformis]|eukprot:gene225-401_t
MKRDIQIYAIMASVANLIACLVTLALYYAGANALAMYRSLCAATVVLTLYTCSAHDCRFKTSVYRSTLIVNAFSIMSGTAGLLMARTKRTSLHYIALANVVFGVIILFLQVRQYKISTA